MAKNDKCKAKDCHRMVSAKSAKGYCPMHYTRYLKHGSPYIVKQGGIKKVVRQCSVEWCNEMELQKSYCPRHYMKWYRHGDPLFKIHVRGRTPEVVSWSGMKQRCNNSKDSSYKNYGGRGIKYQKSWEVFDNFYKDMGKRPKGTTLDRIDVNGDYTKENCRWATTKEQANNRTTSVYIEYGGLKLTVQEWSEKLGIRRRTLAWRIENWSDTAKVLYTPEGPTGPKGK